jgi:poly(hydroxyalkanoate) granule-associated protein
MATLKKKSTRTTARKTAAGNTTRKRSTRSTARKSSGLLLNAKSITESAQQIWLAGMGALTRAQAEGTKLFETLVRDGLSLEQTARKFAGSRASAVRDAVEGQVEQARERAADTWDKLEKLFEERVQRALVRLGVPTREDLQTLNARVETLTEALRQSKGDASQTAARTRTSAKAATAKKATPAKPATAAKAGNGAKVTTTRAPRKAAVKPQQAPTDTTPAPAADTGSAG